MIERYFIKGVTYTWVAPQPVSPPAMDGTIVQSGSSHPPALMCLGLDTEIKYGKTLSPSHYGLTNNFVIPHRWLNYVLGRTAYVRSTNTDVLTGFMSGCWICSWVEHGHRRVGHVGTVDIAEPDQPPNSTVKTTFINSAAGQHGSHLKGYSPANAWGPNEIVVVMNESKTPGSLAARILSLVTTTDGFYSILMIRRLNSTTPNLWVCGGIKQVHGHHRATVVQRLS